MLKKRITFAILCVFLLYHVPLLNATRPYKYELSAMGGCGYVLGETNRYVFQHACEMYGFQFRYKWKPRVAFQTKLYGMRAKGDVYLEDLKTKTGEQWANQLMSWDVTGEFNFFRFGDKQYDLRYREITPYMYVGAGCCVHSQGRHVCAYLPFGIGMKWRFKKRYGLTVTWQHQLYLADNLENDSRYNNTHNMNGANFFNFDTGGMLMAGFVIKFGREKPICNMCE